MAAHVPPPAGVRSPMLWGTEDHLRELLGDGIASLDVTERTYTFRFPSPEQFVAFFRRWYGPTVKAFAALEGPARDALEADLVALADGWDRLGDGAVAIPAAYTEAVASGDEPELGAAPCGALTRRGAELRQHGGDMVLGRARRDDEPVGDLRVSEPGGHQLEHLELARGEAGRVRAGRLAGARAGR